MADKWELKAILSAVDNMSPALKSITAQAQIARNHLAAVGGAASNLAGRIGLPLGLIGGVMAGFSGIAIKNAVVGFTDMSEELYNMSLRTGMTVEELQKLKYVAEQSGVTIESLQGAMGKLNFNLVKAAQGQAPAVVALMKRLNINLRDANGEIVRGVDVLPQLADAFERNSGTAIESAMGMALFGKQWQSVIPLLADGSRGINESIDRFQRLKHIIPLETLREAKELGDKFKDLQFLTKGFQVTVASQLVPALSSLTEEMVDWAAENRTLIAQDIKETIAPWVESLRQIEWKNIIGGVRDFTSGLGRMVDMVGGARNALIGVAVVMNAQTILAVGSLALAVGRAAFAFVGMALQAYIAGNAAMLSMIRTGVVAVATTGWIGALGAAFPIMAASATSASSLVAAAWANVSLAIRGVGAAIMANPLGVLLSLAGVAWLIYDNWSMLKKWFGSFFDWMGEGWEGLLDWMTGFIEIARPFLGLGPAPGSTPRATGGSDLTLANRGNALVGTSRVQASGQIEVIFKDAPPGMRVEQISNSGDVAINPHVGLSSAATGMP